MLSFGTSAQTIPLILVIGEYTNRKSLLLRVTVLLPPSLLPATSDNSPLSPKENPSSTLTISVPSSKTRPTTLPEASCVLPIMSLMYED